MASETFAYSYVLNYYNGSYYVVSTDQTGDLSVIITDTKDSTNDNTGILGDITNDVLVGALSNDPNNLQTGYYVGTGSNAADSSSGIVIKLSPDSTQYYYLTNTPITAPIGTAVIDVGFGTTTVICFVRGTMIRTPEGEVAVETLKRGDLVLASGGEAKPVRWLGRQTISTVFADPLRVLPIRIKAGALSENVPARDLLLSPDHAVLVEGALVQAGALLNGTSIVRETTVPKVFVYYHVELDDHSLILAENTPAETFIDNIDRMHFDNWAEHQALYPEGKAIKELPYPRAKAHRQVPVEIRIKLADRAQKIGAATDAAAA
jgi:hypothetical protein